MMIVTEPRGAAPGPGLAPAGAGTAPPAEGDAFAAVMGAQGDDGPEPPDAPDFGPEEEVSSTGAPGAEDGADAVPLRAMPGSDPPPRGADTTADASAPMQMGAAAVVDAPGRTPEPPGTQVPGTQAIGAQSPDTQAIGPQTKDIVSPGPVSGPAAMSAPHAGAGVASLTGTASPRVATAT